MTFVACQKSRKADIYIDNIIFIGLWLEESSRLVEVVFLAIKLVERPINLEDSFLRDLLLSISKLLVKEKLSEISTALG